MLNNTEHNNTVICVLPVGVKLPTPKNYDAYCRKYAPTHTRKVGQNNFEWELIDDYLCTSVSTKHHKYEFGITEYENDFSMCVNEFFDDGTYVGSFVIDHIPMVKYAMFWAERYSKSFIALWGKDEYGFPITREWEDVCSIRKLEYEVIKEVEIWLEQ